jgi:hypothetical protein
VVAAVNLPLIDREFVLHRKAHGQKGTVRGYHSFPNNGLRRTAVYL